MIIEREVRKWGCELRTIKHLIYVNRSGEVCIIKCVKVRTSKAPEW